MADALDDETLVAFVDGELDTAAAARVRQAAQADPALQRRITVLRESRECLEAAFRDVAREPVPERLLDALAPPRRTTPAWQPLALAAGLGALAVGLLFAMQPGLLPGGAAPAPALARFMTLGPEAEATLEGAPSGTTRRWPAGDGLQVELEPLLSARDRGEGPCRQYRQMLRSDGAVTAAAVGVACRDEGAGWSVLALTPLAPPSAGREGDGYELASGAAGPAADVLEALLPGTPMTPDQERRALADGW